MSSLSGFAILLLMQACGELLTRALQLPLPGAVVGMVLLFAALACKPVRKPVRDCAEYLLSHLSLLFVPISVGVMQQWPLLQQFGGRIVLVLVVSTALGLAVTAWTIRALMQPPAPADGSADAAAPAPVSTTHASTHASASASAQDVSHG